MMYSFLFYYYCYSTTRVCKFIQIRCYNKTIFLGILFVKICNLITSNSLTTDDTFQDIAIKHCRNEVFKRETMSEIITRSG